MAPQTYHRAFCPPPLSIHGGQFELYYIKMVQAASYGMLGKIWGTLEAVDNMKVTIKKSFLLSAIG